MARLGPTLWNLPAYVCVCVCLCCCLHARLKRLCWWHHGTVTRKCIANKRSEMRVNLPQFDHHSCGHSNKFSFACLLWQWRFQFGSNQVKQYHRRFIQSIYSAISTICNDQVYAICSSRRYSIACIGWVINVYSDIISKSDYQEAWDIWNTVMRFQCRSVCSMKTESITFTAAIYYQ